MMTQETPETPQRLALRAQFARTQREYVDVFEEYHCASMVARYVPSDPVLRDDYYEFGYYVDRDQQERADRASARLSELGRELERLRRALASL